MERKPEGLVCWSLWRQNGIQGLEEGLSTGIALLPFDVPTLEPLHVGALFNHVVAMPTRDGNERHCFGVVANLLDVGTYLLLNLFVTRLSTKNRIPITPRITFQKAKIIIWGKAMTPPFTGNPELDPMPLALPVQNPLMATTMVTHVLLASRLADNYP